MMEEWRIIPEFPNYEASSDGNIRRRENQRYLKPFIINSGYLQLALRKDGKTYWKLVHTLVANAFLPIDDSKPVVDHLDDNYYNNKLSNLERVTQKENLRRCHERGNVMRDSLGRFASVLSD